MEDNLKQDSDTNQNDPRPDLVRSGLQSKIGLPLNGTENRIFDRRTQI